MPRPTLDDASINSLCRPRAALTGSLLIVALAAPLGAAGCGGNQPAASKPPREETFTQPRTVSPSDGVVELTLQPTELTLEGRRMCLRAYGEVPGPTIRVPDGEDRSVRVDLQNGFEEPDYRLFASADGYGEEYCYDFNLTNLHAHGSHVSPTFASGGDECESPGCADVDGDGSEDGVYFADNVLNEVRAKNDESGKSLAKYRWDIDRDTADPDHPGGKHWPGTHWYHPHIHGSTAIQVASGAAGLLIIEGDIDQVAPVRDARERVMVMSHIPYDNEEENEDGERLVTPLEEGEPCDGDHISVNNYLGVHHRSNTVLNGKVSPRLVTAPGQVERWRMLHAGAVDEMWIGIFEGTDEDCSDYRRETPVPIQQFAADGVALPETFDRDYWFMSPGYRIDALVRMPDKETTLCVESFRTNSYTDLTRISSPEPGNFQGTELIAIIHVDPAAGEPTSTALLTDAELAAVAPPVEWQGTFKGEEGVAVSCDQQGADLSVEPDQKMVLTHPAFVDVTSTEEEEERTQSGGGSCDPSHHHEETEESTCVCPLPNINCRIWHPRRMFRHTDADGVEHAYRNDRIFVAGSTELWELSATDGHPFHVHVNPYVVCPAVTAREPPFAHWRDTYFVESTDLMADGNRPRRILSRYASAFTGGFTLHCHKLNHEDEGMMELAEVCAPDDTECLCLLGETDEDGHCIESNAGCFEDDAQCRFAATVVASYSPGDYAELEEPTIADLTSEDRQTLADAGLTQCCQAVEGGTPPEILAAYLALGMSGVECCPAELLDVSLPGNPCKQ